MAFYKTNRDLQLGSVFRSGLDNLRDGMDKLQRCHKTMQQQTPGQVADLFGVAPTEPGGDDAVAQAQGLRDEVASTIGKLLNPDSDVFKAIDKLLSVT
jgi:hypothetical protein